MVVRVEVRSKGIECGMVVRVRMRKKEEESGREEKCGVRVGRGREKK